MAAALGSASVHVDCPVCGHGFDVAFTLTIADVVRAAEGHAEILGRIELDEQDVYAHLLTHAPHDGEPLGTAA